uniref:Reverse transcriptase domain-containing protein n=1 Tax=Tanacetum cinerariifolium TaxID=118510 RepID=A0A699KL65_TANCI|nr:reverse transcriptase domain-containing protein [Tanacetum cinerariifolium]
MAASAIIVSSDSFEESVGTPSSRVILFGNIPTVIPSTSVIALMTSAIAPVISSVTPLVEMTLVTSLTRLCRLVPYLDFDSDSPDEMDSPKTLMLLPLLVRGAGYTDSTREAILLGRTYHTRPHGPRRVMTARKRVGPLPAWRHVSPRSSDHRPSSSSLPTDSSPVHSLGLDAPDQAHYGSSTRGVSPRLGYPPRCRSPTDYVPSSLVTRSLAPTCANLLPPRKRFRDSYSSETSMEEDTEIDTTKTEDDRELDIVDRDDARNHIEIDPRDVRDDTKEYEADTSAGDMVEVGIDPMSAPVADEESEEPAGEDSSNSSGTRDGIVRSFEDMPINLDDVVRDFYHHMSEVRIDRIVRIGTVQRRLEADQLIASRERTRIPKRIESLRSENLKVRALLCIERDRMDSLRLHMSRSQEKFRIKYFYIVFRGCTLGLLGHPFNIDLMPTDLDSFEVIIGMDWLAKNHVMIVCDEKIVRIPYENEILIIQGDKSDKGKKSTLSIISCLKTQKYMEKGLQVFLAQVTKKEIEDKSKEKQLEDVPTVWDFPEVFPKDLPGLPPTRQVKF